MSSWKEHIKEYTKTIDGVAQKQAKCKLCEKDNIKKIWKGDYRSAIRRHLEEKHEISIKPTPKAVSNSIRNYLSSSSSTKSTSKSNEQPQKIHSFNDVYASTLVSIAHEATNLGNEMMFKM